MLLLLLTLGTVGAATTDVDLAALCADRAAIERVYYNHRLGEKPPFEQLLTPDVLESLVQQDLHKEAALRQVYGETITPEMLDAEVQRINATTRAPDVLAELKRALNNDAARFARTVAAPIAVERELRRHFDNDNTLHTAARQQAEQARLRLLAGEPVDGMRTITWQLTPRPRGEAPAATPHPAGATTNAATGGIYAVASTAQLAQVLASPAHRTPEPESAFFEDLNPALQHVLKTQLQKPGDVSAVIETPGGFLVFVAGEKSTETLSATTLSIPKRSLEDWLTQLREVTP